jgi:hypothetical protein
VAHDNVRRHLSREELSELWGRATPASLLADLDEKWGKGSVKADRMLREACGTLAKQR